MATNYSQEIKTNIEKLDYNAVQALYECINRCCVKRFTTYNPSFDILYNRGSISCNTNTYDEFIRDAYGLEIEVLSISINDFKTGISFHIGYYLDTTHVKSGVKISINSGNINNISIITPQLQKELEDMDTDKKKDGTSQIPSISVNVGRDLTMHDSAIGTQNTISKNTLKGGETSSKSSWWTPIWQSITANIILWIIGISGTVIAILYRIFK